MLWIEAQSRAVFKREWWRFYGEAPTGFKKIVLSLDSAFKVGTENDYTVGTVWGVTNTGFYLLHLWRQRVEFPELIKKLTVLAEEWRPHVILVEDKASAS